MNSCADKIANLRERVNAAHEEFNLAVTFHEAWKPSAYDAQLRERMGVSYATNTFKSIRVALRREMLLALMRLWDKGKQTPRMEEDIATPLHDVQIIAELALQRASKIGLPEAEHQIRKELGEQALAAVEIIAKYGKNGSRESVLKHIMRLRHERLAHRQVAASRASEASATDQQIEEFYQDHARLIHLLMSLINATAYNPMDAADVYAHYARFFWAGVQGERTVGHPNYRPQMSPGPKAVRAAAAACSGCDEDRGGSDG
jgi:hypothetical protein